MTRSRVLTGVRPSRGARERKRDRARCGTGNHGGRARGPPARVRGAVDRARSLPRRRGHRGIIEDREAPAARRPRAPRVRHRGRLLPPAPHPVAGLVSLGQHAQPSLLCQARGAADRRYRSREARGKGATRESGPSSGTSTGPAAESGGTACPEEHATGSSETSSAGEGAPASARAAETGRQGDSSSRARAATARDSTSVPGARCFDSSA